MRTNVAEINSEWWEARTRLDPATGCRIWIGSGICRLGYGRVTTTRSKSPELAHRLAYECVYGPFDKDLKVCHRCDTPGCVNGVHLFLGTQKDNLRDMFAKGRGRPQGRAAGWREAVAVTPLLSSSLAPEKARKCVGDNDLVHLTRTSAMTAPWCRVIGQPSASDSAEIPAEKRPRWWTVELPPKSSTVSDCGDSGALVSEAAS